jgi:hypothetical protein
MLLTRVGGLLFLGVSFTVSLTVLIFVLTRLPATYFRGSYSPRFWPNGHPMLHWAGLAGKNLLGVSLVMLGIFLALPAIAG